MHHTRTRTIILLLTAALLLVAGLAWGLTGAVAESPSPGAGDEPLQLKLGMTVDADSLNPFVGYTGAAYEVWSLNYDFLVGHDTEGNPAPALAESWEVSDDGLTWTFQIRQDAKWHDGEPVTAEDIAFTYNYILEKKVDTLTPYLKNLDEAVATDEYVVEMRCSKPKANLLDAWIYVVPEHIWSKIDDPLNYKMEYPIIGSGPFQCVEWKKDNFERMVRVPGYWGGEPTVDEVIFQCYTNTDTMAQELEAGSLDGASAIPPEQYKQLIQDDRFTGYEMNIFTFEYLCFNCYDSPDSKGHPVMKDVKFRQALNWAVDKDQLVEIGLGGYGRPGTVICPPDEWPDDRDPHYEVTDEEKFGFDIDKAKQLLDEAGYTDSDGNGIREYKGKDIELRLWSRQEAPESQKEAKLIVGWFEEAGIKIEYEVVDDGTLNDAIYNYDPVSCAYAPDYDMYLWDWWGYIDAGDTLVCFTSDQIEWWNDSCWTNAEYDQLAADQYGEMDVAKRMEMLQRMQQIYYVESPYIVLTYPDSLQVNNTEKWEGWKPFLGGHPWYSSFNTESYLSLKPKAAESEDEGSSTTLWVAIGVVAAIVVIVVVALLTRRGKGQAVEE